MYYFIVNLTSRTGKAREIWIQVQRELKKREIAYEAYVTERKGHAIELARKLCTKGAAYKKEHEGEKVCLVVVGGDGTANEVVNGMHHFDEICFGYIATGSGNDLGRGLKISKDPVEALNGILNATEVYPMDLGTVTTNDGKTFRYAISSGIGIDADACRAAFIHTGFKKFLNSIKLGSMVYILLTLKALFTMPTTEVTLHLKDGTSKKIKKMIFVAGMNHACEGGGVPMAPKADAQDGELSVCCVSGYYRWQTFFLLPVLMAGKHENLKGFDIFNCSSYELKLEKEMALHADGEYLGQHTCIRYSCEKGILKVLK